jgi:hypothetical protein
VKDKLVDIGTWNVSTMLKAGKMQKIAVQIVGSQIQIFALEQIRSRVYGLLKKDKYSIYYSCNPISTGQAGTVQSSTKTGNEQNTSIRLRTDFRPHM